MVAAMAQWEREEIADRVAASVPIRARMGKPLGGQAPFGYQWRDHKLVPNPEEAPMRKLIYELFSEHRRKKTVARILNERGYRTRKGAEFSVTTIARLLRDPSAKGVHRANYTKSQGDRRNWALKPESEWVLTRVEPIVSEELWEQCNQILDEQKSKYKRPARKAVHLFTGFAYCSCGTKMYVPSNSPKYICYKCRNKISVTDLEKIFHEELKSFFFSGEEIAKYLQQADDVIKERQQLLTALEQERRDLIKEMDRTFELYQQDQISVQGFGERYRPMEERLNQLKEETPKLEAEIVFLKSEYDSSDEILSEAQDLYSRWPKLNREEKRAIIESITEKITIGKEDVTINLCYLPSPSEYMAERSRSHCDW